MEFEYRYTENCIFKGNCPRERRMGCDEFCSIQPEFYYLLNTSNIPKKYIPTTKLYPSVQDEDVFMTLQAIKEDIENFVKDGRTLYIWGANIGSGKSSWAIKLFKTYLATICIGNGFRDRAWMEYIPTLLLKTKNFKTGEREEILQKLNTRDLVLLDDIGAVRNTEYDMTILSDVINRRYSDNLSTIYTSNLSPRDLKTSLDVRLADRVCSDIVLEIKGASHRKKVDYYERRE